MQRILVVGPCGAGKSTLGFALAERLGLPLFHMDRLKWQPGWVEETPEVLLARIDAVIAQDRWVLEGTYGGTLARRLPRADAVIFLDYAIPLCLWRLIARIRRWRGRTRPDMTPGCEERFDLGFFLYVAQWRLGPGKRLDQLLGPHGSKVVRLRSPRATAAWLASLEPV